MSQFIQDRQFTFTISDVQKNFKDLPAGSNDEKNLKFSISIIPKKDNSLKFKFLFNELPKSSPFWAILSVQIQGQEFKIFINDEMQVKPFKEAYPTPFQKDIFSKCPITITYKLTQIPSYICTLTNSHECVCYMNSSIQLLFHLAKFRSFLFKILNDDESSWLYRLIKLFKTMCSSKSSLSTQELTESFGWPSLARKIPHDASEFILFLLNHVRENEYLDSKDRENFDAIFTSHVINESDKSVTQLKIIDTSFIDKKSTFIDTFHNDMLGKKFLKFPEVLFLSVTNIRYPDLQRTLDLSRYAVDKQASNYVLSGMIVRVHRQKQIKHFVSFVRASFEEIWMYFSDTVEINYPWTYDKKTKKNISPVDSTIRENIDKWQYQITVLMYVREDVIKDYFCYTPNVIPVKSATKKKADPYNGPTRTIMITTNDDINKYVKDGHTDFEKVGSSITFSMDAKLSFSSVYEFVSKELNVPLGSFILRTESKTGAPFFHRFEDNSKSILENIHTEKIHLYYEANENSRDSNDLRCIPFYFLFFKFNPLKFIHNIHDNLTHSAQENFPSSIPLNMRLKKKIQRTKSVNASKADKQKEKKKEEKKLEKNCYHFLTSLVLNTESKFEKILPKLIELINKSDTFQHNKIHLYTAEYNSNDSKKIGYKEIDVKKKIKDCVPQITYGTYIYVQCEDDFTDDTNIDQRLIGQIKPKFLFFKYMDQALQTQSFPKEIPNVFMLENYSVPVTFCKLSDPKNKTKTMLFPLRIKLTQIEQLEKIICFAMNEKYPENGLIQLFFSFKEDSPPFQEPLFGKTSIKGIIKILEFSMRTISFNQRFLNLSGSSSLSMDKSDIDLKTSEEKEKIQEPETDTTYKPAIFIHYHIFDHYNSDVEKPVRVYFSEDAISIQLTTQILVRKSCRVLNIAEKLLNIFSQGLSEEDKSDLLAIKKGELKFNDVYRCLKICDGKISSQIQLDSEVTRNMEIRFERIPGGYSQSELAGYIPVFYGALYKTNYNTNYIGSIGTPFYFPVLKSDLGDPKVTNFSQFKKSNLYTRLKSMINEKEVNYELCVVNYAGFIQKVDVNELEKIIQKNLNYSVCLNYLNASTFIDEDKFFSNGIRLLRET